MSINRKINSRFTLWIIEMKSERDLALLPKEILKRKPCGSGTKHDSTAQEFDLRDIDQERLERKRKRNET